MAFAALRNAHIVNAGSRFALAIALAFTVFGAAPALADSVALLSVDGRADPERLEEIEQHFASALRAQGHTLAAPSGDAVSRPPASAQMQTIATGSNAAYVVAAEVEPLRGQYRLAVHVYSLSAGRMEELVVTVLEADEEARIRDVLSAMVRPEGLGEDALRLTGEPEDTGDREAREAEEAARREAEEAARREAEEAAQRETDARAAREAEEAAAREAEEAAAREAEEAAARERAFEERVPYAGDAPWMLQVMAGGGYALPLGELNLPPNVEPGGGVFDFGVRLAHSIEGVDGLELRGGVDGHVGVTNLFGIHVGAAWLASLFVEPIFIGASAEVGFVYAFTGAREAGFSARVSALFAWRALEHLYLEVSIPEIGLITPGAGAVTFGASAHVGYRF